MAVMFMYKHTRQFDNGKIGNYRTTGHLTFHGRNMVARYLRKLRRNGVRVKFK